MNGMDTTTRKQRALAQLPHKVQYCCSCFCFAFTPGVAAAVYGGPRMGVRGMFQGTPTMNMIIKIPRKKKKVNEGTTFSGIKRVVKERTKKVVA